MMLVSRLAFWKSSQSWCGFVKTNWKLILSPAGVGLPEPAKEKLIWPRGWDAFVSYTMLYNTASAIWPLLCSLSSSLQPLVLRISHAQHRLYPSSPFTPLSFSTSHFTLATLSMLISHPYSRLKSTRALQIDDRWSPSPIPPIWNAVGGLRASVFSFFQLACTNICFCSSRYSILSTQHKHILYPIFYAQDAPSSEEMSGV